MVHEHTNERPIAVWTLGLNWVWHDAAACLVDSNGRPVAFVEEERLCRSKYAIDMPPRRSAAYCLSEAGINCSDVDTVAVGWHIPRMFPEWYSRRDRRTILRVLLGRALGAGRLPELVFIGHHEAHAYSTFYASGYGEAAVLVVDGSGERDSASIYYACRDRPLKRLHTYPINQSLGAMYEGASLALGLGRFGAGKTMGLAAYGRDGLLLDELSSFLTDTGLKPAIGVDPRASYHDWSSAWHAWFRDRLPATLPPPSRLAESREAVRCAWTCQWLVEHELARLSDEARALTGLEALALAGGVILNCSANGRLEPPVYVPPVPHDAGVALGAAWAVCPPKAIETPLTPYLGPSCTSTQVDAAFRSASVIQKPFHPVDAAALLTEGAIGGIVDSRAEAGPRALGHRSLVALPRPAAMRDQVNQRKGREPWRPLAPVAATSTAGGLWSSRGVLARYMLAAAHVSTLGAQVLPAAVHVDGTARCQEIGHPPHQGAAIMESILKALAGIGVPPVLINTSLNGPGEPIACTAGDAARCFADLPLDFLVVGERMLLPDK